MPRTHPCPKCGRTLRAEGEIIVHLSDGDCTAPVFSCDECLMLIDFGGETMEVCLMFALDANGKEIDPASPDGELRF